MSTPSTQHQAMTWAQPERAAHFTRWLQDLAPTHQLQTETVRPASADASFRRYFRIDATSGSRIIMDAPPDREDNQPFVEIANLMRTAGLRVPEVLAWEREHGFLLLSDLGDATMLQAIQAGAPAHPLYLQALDTLLQWQLASQAGVLPPYDTTLLRRELELFPQWYLTTHRGVAVDGAMRKTLDDTFAVVIEDNLSWPSVFVHRDFMPRNLMVGGSAQEPLGVLDFQDAVFGPITYDIASLMRDAFISWEEDFCLDIIVRYWERARKAGLPVGDDFGAFYRSVEWMGLQRHLKIAGIFARLTLRDGKPQYLADTPRFIHYLRSTCSRYRELKPLLRLIEKIEGIEVPQGFAFGRV